MVNNTTEYRVQAAPGVDGHPSKTGERKLKERAFDSRQVLNQPSTAAVLRTPLNQILTALPLDRGRALFWGDNF